MPRPISPKTRSKTGPRTAPDAPAGKAVPQRIRQLNPTQPATAEHPLIERQKQVALQVLDDSKGEDLRLFALRGHSALADYVIVASGRSSRQIAAMAGHLRDQWRALGVRQTRIEGQPPGDWVVADSGDVVVHLFRPEVRRYYQIEDIWQPYAVTLPKTEPGRLAPASGKAKKPAAAKRPAATTAKPATKKVAAARRPRAATPARRASTKAKPKARRS